MYVHQMHWKAREARKRVVYEPRALSSVVSGSGPQASGTDRGVDTNHHDCQKSVRHGPWRLELTPITKDQYAITP